MFAMKSKTKEMIQYSTATLMVVSGVILTILCFFMKGDVTNGVLWYVAQSLSFAGGVFGISIYFRAKLGESEDRIRQFINTKMEK